MSGECAQKRPTFGRRIIEEGTKSKNLGSSRQSALVKYLGPFRFNKLTVICIYNFVRAWTDVIWVETKLKIYLFGNTMGNKLAKRAVKSTVVRPLRNYDVEERAMKVISREIPKSAPPHPSMKKMMDDIRSDPNLLTKAKEDPVLMDKLQHVFLTSQGENSEIATKAKLPQERAHPEGWEFGFNEPTKVPVGKITFRKMLELLANHQVEPETFTAEKLAKDYNLDLENVKNIIRYFKPFILYTPKKKPEPSAFMKAIKA
ncbi:unnamed protein product [Allacma fusca]|uniref:NADH dehydrogenase [ubiquinone] 1 alpha subcomplex assembly factor 4 n=1 Tax=Allacma fusca TaxID=39272 RepID=A0A8J2P789_9HEXA|nr:unnamed protein product [Allacma fusca]